MSPTLEVDYRLLFESSPGLFLVLLPDAPKFTIVAVSDEYVRQTMTKREEILGKGIFQVFPDNPEEAAASGVRNLSNSLIRVIETRRPDAVAIQKYDIRKPAAEGGGFEERYWSPSQSPVLDSEGNLKYLIHRAEDVTELIKLKQLGTEQTKRSIELLSESERMEAEILRRGQQIQKANERLAELDRMKTQFFANISHELRTPLALILVPTEKWLRSSAITEDLRRDLTIMLRNAKGLLKTVNDLLDVSKLEAGKLVPKYTAVDLAHLARLTGSLFEVTAREREIKFILEVPQTLLAEADGEMIQRCLVNLISNAFKFIPDGGTITCRLYSEGELATFQVEDNGPGVPKAMHEVIFERFRQVEGGSTRKHGGTGLGLAITKEFVELHRGKIKEEDAPGGGALFTFTLPLKAPAGIEVVTEGQADIPTQIAPPLVEELGTPLPQTEVAIGTQRDKKGVVLVVEDNTDMNYFITQTLSSEFSVLTAFNGREGINQALKHQPDLIVSDIMMPIMSGDEMVQEIRQKAELADIPILVLSAKADDELRVKLLQELVQDFVTKPFSGEELKARTRNLVSVKRARALLQGELATKLRDLEELAKEVILRRQDLQRSLSETKVAKEEVERMLRLRDEFISVAAHELKTPLTPLIIQNKLLKIIIESGKFEGAKLEEHLKMSDRQLKRLADLLENLLDVSRIHLGLLTLKCEEVNLSQALQSVVDRFGIELEVAKCPLEINTAKDVVGHWDRLRIEQVITNLISNAIKYGRGKPIHITVTSKNGSAILSVRDFGAGIAKDDQNRIFNRFERAESMRSYPGIGLGLYISKEIVLAHGGKISINSELGAGAEFIVELPMKGPAA